MIYAEDMATVKEATRQIIFPLGFSAGFCSQCAKELVQDKIGVENSRNITIEETTIFSKERTSDYIRKNNNSMHYIDD